MTAYGGLTQPSGELGLRVIRNEFDQMAALSRYPAKELDVREIAYWGLPRTGLPAQVNTWRAKNARNLWRGARRVLTARALGLSNVYGSLYLTHIKASGEVVELGLASMRVVTTAGVNYLVGTFAGTGATTNIKYHGIGTTNTAEASTDTALVAESTTALNPDNTRATGSTTTGGSSNVYRTVGTLTADATIAAVEHGVFTQSATGGGTLWDRSIFSTVTLASGDSLQATYDCTFAAGS
jgi:hypothetical protein